MYEVGPFLNLANFHKKWNKKFKVQTWSDFGGFQSPHVRGKKERKIHEIIYIYIFQYVTQNIKGWLNNFISDLDPNLASLFMDDHSLMKPCQTYRKKAFKKGKEKETRAKDWNLGEQTTQQRGP
jgi:hypothetical protein